MRFKWDENKNKKLKADNRRGFGFETVKKLFDSQYYLDQKNDDPAQFRAIGIVDNKLVTLIFESREDHEGEYYHFITYWFSTKTERSLYEKG
ncbi:MAG: BrnT family toxin [Oligoflexia bacterium]|nr:BrnT family toxin [Oligoflexia bacterium]